AVMSEQDRDYFYDRTHSRKTLGYGILEYDLDSRTRLSLSGTVQDDVTHVPTSGLPAYSNWTYLTVPRSTNVLPDWDRYHWTTQEVTADAEHRFDNRWVAKLRLSRREQSFFFKDSYPDGSGVDPATMTTNYNRRQADYDYQQSSLDMYLNGPFELFGRTHNLLLGANRFRLWTTYAKGTASTVNGVSIFDPNSVPEPDVTYNQGGENETIQYGTYGQLRLSLADPLTLVLGARVSDYKYKSHNAAPGTPSAWTPGANTHMHITPYTGLVYDLTHEVSLYASYSDIFMPQTAMKKDGNVVKPREGRQVEIGTKGSFLDGRLNGSLALFRIHDQNRAVTDPSDSNYSIEAGEAESEGWEATLSGRPMAGLDVTASFSNLNTKYLQNGASTGQPISDWYPRNMFKLWSKYSPAGDRERGWTVGGGLDASSHYSANGTTAATMYQGGFTVVNALVGYRFDRHLSLNLNANNLFDRVYHTSGVRTIGSYNGYGEPRSVLLTLNTSM
ncbi:MAG: TonB-dependent siderophore receptor, partial [Zoogloea sp.]|nr:TonB-dependent siderophore receptor [Zoogloea sp.]